ncbi:MAG: hypothetical protein ACRCUY_00370 [Thermoguttaceae bacterium]
MLKTKRIFVSFIVCLVISNIPLFAETVLFDFESGDLNQEGWKVIEGENTKPIGSRDMEFHNNSVPYQKHGKFYLTTLEHAADDRPVDAPMCVMESPVFIVSGKEASIHVGGGKREKTYIALVPVNEDGSLGDPVEKARGLESQGLSLVTWNVEKWNEKPFLLQVVDLETGGWGHIRMDNFQVEGRIDSKLTQKRADFLQEQRDKVEKEKKSQQERAKIESGLLDQPIIYVTRPQYKPDHHNTATLFQLGEINENSFVGGGSVRIWNPKDDSVQVLLETPDGIIRDISLSFDAKKFLVSIRRDKQDFYHIYELDLVELQKLQTPIILKRETSLEKHPIRQLTFLEGVSDIDPLYLPSGEIIFSSTREPKYCMCNRHIMCNLYKMNGDGSNIQQIGKSTLFEGHASLTPDGRILYDRWEYVDRNFGDAQGVWISTTEGFNHAIFWGNNTSSPGGVLDTRIVPGSSSEFIATFTSCHDRPWGAIALVDRQRGIDGKESVIQTWPADAIDLVDQGGYDTFTRVNPKLEDPFPLSENWFLASGMTGNGEKTGIYLLGRNGTMAMVHEDADVLGCFDPMPIVATTPPPISAQKADLSRSTGTFYVSDVYTGFGMESVPKGSVKSIRVVESPEKRTWSAAAWDNGTGQQAPGMGWKDFNNKRILGTIPVEEDGSVHFEVPADTFLYLQILDEEGRMIQSMRSGMIVRPGETNGCFGCHEDRLASFPPIPVPPKAMSKPAQELKAWHGENRLFSYVEEVQKPVFDKYCITCHDYGKVENNPNKPNLAGDLNTIFNTSYVELQTRQLVKPVGAGPHVKLKPYSWGSTQSRLAEVLLHGHPKPEIDAKRKDIGVYIDKKTNPEAVDRVLTWIDINTPYYGTYLTPFPTNRYGRSPLSNAQFNRLAELCGYNTKGYDLDWAISFTRPEISRCLNKWKTPQERETPEYLEALSIIHKGGQILQEIPRGEIPELVPPPERDAAQQEKYDRMKAHEQKMREAIKNGNKYFDSESLETLKN